MAKQFDLDKAYMECAFAMAKLSYAKRKKVGAILVSPNGGIIAEGVNGTYAGADNNCEFIYAHRSDSPFIEDAQAYFCAECKSYTTDLQSICKMVTKPDVIHAESNCIMKIAKSTNSSLGSTMYITCSPCFECSKLIIQAGVRRIVYAEQYRIIDGLDLLKKANIEVCYLNDSQTI